MTAVAYIIKLAQRLQPLLDSVTVILTYPLVTKRGLLIRDGTSPDDLRCHGWRTWCKIVWQTVAAEDSLAAPAPATVVEGTYRMLSPCGVRANDRPQKPHETIFGDTCAILQYDADVLWFVHPCMFDMINLGQPPVINVTQSTSIYWNCCASNASQIAMMQLLWP